MILIKFFIIRLNDEWDSVKALASEAVTHGLTNFFTNVEENALKLRELGNINIYSFSNRTNPDVFIFKNKEIDKLPTKKNRRFGYYITIEDKNDEELVRKASQIGSEIIIIKGTDWKIIPLENLIADLHKTNCKLAVEVDDLSEAKTMLETLELGADGVLISLKLVDEIEDIKKLLEESINIVLSSAKITKIKKLGMGDRVCIDTCSILNVGEGMLIGSQSNGLFLVHGETFDTEFVASRPFRVNAGAVHAYILLPNGKTQYLSEIESGDEVLVVNSNGHSHKAIVGRSKIEKRPLLLIEAQINGVTLKTIVQNAETIRLVDKDLNAISVAKLKIGDEILVYYNKGGRHFGKLVEKEFVIEK